MKTAAVLLTLVLLSGCSSPDTATPTTATVPDAAAPSAVAAPAPTDEAPPVVAGSASGVVESVDVAAGTVTIAHGAVESLKWPPMTMTFQAPGIDLGAIKQGDQVDFSFTAEGMDGTITSITHR